MKLSRILTANVGAASVDIDGEKFNFSFTKNAITGADMQVLADAVSVKDELATLGDLMSRSLLEWDLEDDDGNVYDITAENALKLPYVTLNEMVEKITDATNPPSGSEKKSSFGS